MTHYIRPLFAASLASAALSISGCADANSSEQREATAQNAPGAFIMDSTATNWTIVVDGSHIRFSALQEGEAFTGEFETFSGLIRFDPETPETGGVEISIPLKSVQAGSKDRNSTLPAKVWFSTKAFPEAKFTSTEISKQGHGYLAKGGLTLKGTTVPIDLPFNLTVDGNRAVMTGQIEMDRTLWNVGAAPWNTDEWVSRAVKLDIQVTADRVN